MAHDLVIRGGTVVDGTGLPSYRADIGIVGDRIAEIGRIAARGAREIDADGKIVSPGFIDAHTHVDAQMNWDALGTSSCWQGVTSVVMGNCGFTLAPSRASARELVLRNLERAEDISAQAMALGVTWNWETFPEYLDAIEMIPKGLNHAVHLGHSALRTWAMGERAFSEQADADDLALMQGQLRAGMAAGAVGFSTSFSPAHETSDDRPVASRLAAWSEIEFLAGSMGGGVFQFALEAESRSLDEAVRTKSMNRLKKLAVDTGLTMAFGTVPASVPQPEVWRANLRLLDDAAAEGGTIYGLTHSRDITLLLSFATNLPFDKLPVWREFRAQPLDVQQAQLRDPAIRAKLEDVANNGPYGRAIGTEARKPDWDCIFLFDKPLPPHRRLSEIAAARGTTPIGAMIDLALESDMACLFQQFFAPQVEAHLLETILHPRTILTFSDTGAHVSQISDCSIQTHLLAYWVRQKRAIGLEQAMRMITLAPARAWGLSDRGLLREGMKADLNVFDAARIAPSLPEVRHDLPGGVKRLIQRAEGIDATIVNGTILMENGEHTGDLPGRLLRRRVTG